MTIGNRPGTACSTISKTQLRGSSWPSHLTFVLGLLLPVLAQCAAISVSLPGPVFSMLPSEHRGLSSGVKTLQPNPYYWPVGLQGWVQDGVKGADRERSEHSARRENWERGLGLHQKDYFF